MTYDDYAALPEEAGRFELVDGQLELMSPGPTSVHQLICGEILFALKSSCEQQYVVLDAPIDVILPPTDVRQPDLVLLHRSRLHLLTMRGIEGAPDVVVEVLSPHTIKRDKIGKMATYAKYGVAEYWIVDPRSESIELYVLEDRCYTLRDVFVGGEPIRTEMAPCASFRMKDIMDKLRDLPIRE